MRSLFKATVHTAAAFDTEGTGLSHMRDLPFLYQFGWYDKPTMTGYTFAVDLEHTPILAHQVITMWHELVKEAPIYLGHNVSFDLHMLQNIGLPYRESNISDSMIWIRLGVNAVPERKGGAPLKLKSFATRFIDPNARDHEKLINQEKSAIAKDLNKKLQLKLGWRKKDIDEFFKDKLRDSDDLPEDKRIAYDDWHEHDLPKYLRPKVTGAVDSDMISYKTLDRENIVMYGHLDIVWVLEAYDMLEEAVRLRGNLDAVRIEEANLYPNHDLERIGFNADKEYILKCRQAVKDYTLMRRQDMYSLAGREFSTSQHAVVKQVLKEMGIGVVSTDASELSTLHSTLKRAGTNPTAVDFIEVLQELRTLEKWYSTYIMRFIVDLKYGSTIYTTINTVGTVSLRVTSDFQQFPKGAIETIDGKELFKPRRMFTVPDGYKAIIYLDYSQIELRLQAMYTILVGHPDLNLCRAYMPYQCHHVAEDGTVIPFNYDDTWCLHNAYTIAWYLDEDSTTMWTPTDVHGATTKAAFNIDETDEDYHDLRYIGKRVNFAKNYGAQRGKIAEMFPEYSDEDITRIDGAYYLAFPGIKHYHDYCYRLANQQPYATNLFGLRYYGVSGHNLINMLIQGSGAYVLKTKIIEITNYLKEKGCKSKLQMQIHDELSFVWHEDDPPELFFELKKIMETFDDFIVPIVADMEVTYTTWADKVEVNSIEELQICTGH